jgi:spore coat polysaccharide biosynthesis protein SpsF (cytidylyltransferase family)
MNFDLEQELGKVKYKMKTAFIICSRTDSTRLPNKPFLKINGVTVIEHLIKRLQKTGHPIIVAFPKKQTDQYLKLNELDNVFTFSSNKFDDDPLGRMYEAATFFSVENIIRVSHDKIFIDQKNVSDALFDFDNMGLDYLYGSKFSAGTGFEIISYKALEKAAKKFKKIEYIGYAIRAVCEKDKIYNFNPRQPKLGTRLLIDYECDLKLLEVIMTTLGNDVTLQNVFKYLTDNPELKQINQMPELTIYTCAYNAAKWIETCMDSVARQKHFKKFEYIIIDDHSTDNTCELIAKFALKHNNVHWFRNETNVGLSTSSNRALKKARGKYIIRLDADDYFVSCTALDQMMKAIQESEKDAIYPNNYFGSLNIIQKGDEKHHVGGTIFNKDAINHIKFTDGLTNHDSLDVFLRAKNQLNIGYLDKAMFFYFQHGKSMSKTNLKDREEIKEKLLTKWAAEDFEDEYDEIDFRELGVEIEPSH